jgi:hypothetical protein
MKENTKGYNGYMSSLNELPMDQLGNDGGSWVIQYYSIHRVPKCLSLRRKWAPPLPPPQAIVCLPPLGPKGGEQHSLL